MIIISGGTGFLGAHLISSLLKNQEKIVVLKRSYSKIDYLLKIISIQGVQHLTHNMTLKDVDLSDIDEVIEKTKDAKIFIHCATTANIFDKKPNLIELNRKVTSNIVNACLTNNVKLLHISSIATIVNNIKEEQEKKHLNPKDTNSVYSLSKLYAELEVWRGIQEGLEAVILHPSLIVGVNRMTNFINLFFKNIKRKKIFIHKQILSLIGIYDVVDIVKFIINNNMFDGENYIINSGNYNTLDIIKTLANKLNIKAKIKEFNIQKIKFIFNIGEFFHKIFNCPIHMETFKYLTTDYYYFSDKFIKKTNYKFRDLETILTEFIYDFEKFNKQ